MASRFHIEDLISQDSSGVIFRAIDQESGQPVALRRFFPSGPDSGGLNAEEKEAYEKLIERFAAASHPALRALITGGCDPVDGVPFVVTEWLEGESLENKLSSGPLTAKQVVPILLRTLEVSAALSQFFGEEAVWVETDLASITESAEESGRGITFWMSPLRWLGAADDRRSLKPISQLTEELMGWKNKLINEQAGNGLATWLKWLKQEMYNATLAEAYQSLAAAAGSAPPASAKPAARPAAKTAAAATPTARAAPTARATPTVRAATAPAAPTRTAAATPAAGTRASATPAQPAPAAAKPSSKLPLIITAVTLLLLLGGGTAWYFVKGEVPLIAKFLPKKAATHNISDEEVEPVAIDPKAVPAGPFTPADGLVLNGMTNQLVTVRGVLERVSDNGKTVYLEFETTAPFSYACGYFKKEGAPADMTAAALKPLEGKTVSITGVLSIQKKPKRPQLLLKDRKAIEVE